MKKWLGGLVLSVTLATTVAGGEAVVHVYIWNYYIGETTIADFELATGIMVVYDVYDSNDVL